jgi:hypothetical protein
MFRFDRVASSKWPCVAVLALASLTCGCSREPPAPAPAAPVIARASVAAQTQAEPALLVALPAIGS